MRIISPLPDAHFTLVPNQLLNSDLEPAQKIAWMQLASLSRKGQSAVYTRKLAGIAEDLDACPRALRRMVNILYKLGAVQKDGEDLVLVIPSAESIEEGEELSISTEMEEKPKRAPSGIDQKGAWELIKEAWNREKPDNYFRLDGKFMLPQFIAFESQAKRLDVERPDYGKFTAQVLRGAAVDEWWSKRDMKLSGIFGYSANIPDTKFSNVEKLYRLGLQAPDTKFSLRDDKTVLRWFNETDPEHGWASVEHIKMEYGDDLWQHEKETVDGQVIYLYHDPESDRIHHWTGKTQISHKFRYTPD
jgi:hypothetical protein